MLVTLFRNSVLCHAATADPFGQMACLKAGAQNMTRLTTLTTKPWSHPSPRLFSFIERLGMSLHVVAVIAITDTAIAAANEDRGCS